MNKIKIFNDQEMRNILTYGDFSYKIRFLYSMLRVINEIIIKMKYGMKMIEINI